MHWKGVQQRPSAVTMCCTLHSAACPPRLWFVSHWTSSPYFPSSHSNHRRVNKADVYRQDNSNQQDPDQRCTGQAKCLQIRKVWSALQRALWQMCVWLSRKPLILLVRGTVWKLQGGGEQLRKGRGLYILSFSDFFCRIFSHPKRIFPRKYINSGINNKYDCFRAPKFPTSIAKPQVPTTHTVSTLTPWRQIAADITRYHTDGTNLHTERRETGVI